MVRPTPRQAFNNNTKVRWAWRGRRGESGEIHSVRLKVCTYDLWTLRGDQGRQQYAGVVQYTWTPQGSAMVCYVAHIQRIPCVGYTGTEGYTPIRKEGLSSTQYNSISYRQKQG